MLEKTLYQVPLKLRVIYLSRPGIEIFTKEKVVIWKTGTKQLEILEEDQVDEVRPDHLGAFLRYPAADENKIKQMSPEYILRHLILIDFGQCFVEAGNPEQAIETFFEQWEGAQVGGQEENQRALWINPEELIFELPSCENLNRNREGRFICGPEKKNGQGKLGMCVIEGFDPPDFYCSINDFRDSKYHADESNRLEELIEVIKYKERTYRLLRAKKLMPIAG